MTPRHPALAAALCALAAAQTPPPAAAPVRNGIDVLIAQGFARLRGRKVGLITNHTGRTLDGTSTVDAFLAAKDPQLVALFSPEHGFAGTLDQAHVADAIHESGLSIHSLYGESRKPTAEALRGVDTLVFDIQDIGCRFYTYVSTMAEAMTAAAEHDLAFVVLDRPNPINGVAVQGPVLDEGLEAFVGCHPIPVRHGMTAGELAQMIDEERGIGCRLDIVRMQGWRRAMWLDECGQVWVDPSPNMRSPDQALLYPGVGLLETTNLSVGRGTDSPFQWIGAPWLDHRRLAATVNALGLRGVRCVPVEFTPGASKFEGEACRGVRFVITDRAALDPLELGMALAWALRTLHPDAWQRDRYPRLLRDEAVFAALERGDSPLELVACWQDELAEFAARRARFLLYD